MRLATPYIFLTTVLVTILALSFVAPKIEKTHSQAAKARNAYMEAIASTRLQLVALVRETAENSTLQENIKWDLKHSINKTLEGDLIEGQLDSLMLVDGQCQIIASSSLNNSPKPPCNNQNLKLTRLFWQSNDTFAPSMNFSFKLPSTEKPYYLVGSVFLDVNQWMPTYPNLYHLKDPLDLRIESDIAAKNYTILLSEGTPNNPQAVLVSGNRLLGWTTYVGSTPWSKVGYLVLIGLLASAYLWWSNKNLHDSNIVALQNFAFWAKKFARVKDEDKENFSHERHGSSPLENAKQTLEKFHEEYKDRLKKTSEETLSLHSEVRQLKSQINLLEDKLSSIVPIESLAIQIAESRDKFANDSAQLIQKIKKIIDINSQGVSKNTGSSKAILNRWQKEIDQRGARRFFRAMSEQVVDTGESLLEQQFSMLYKTTVFADEQSINITKQVQAVNENLRELFRQTSYWCDLASKSDHNTDTDYSLMDACLNAQQMIVKSSGLNPVFENQLDFEQDPGFNQVPKNIWISIIFHIYDMFLDVTGDRANIKIRTWQKNDAAKKLLILSTAHDLGEGIDIKNIQSRDFDLARKLSQQFGLCCERLPDLSGTIAIAISIDYQKTQEVSLNKEKKPAEKPSAGYIQL